LSHEAYFYADKYLIEYKNKRPNYNLISNQFLPAGVLTIRDKSSIDWTSKFT